MNVDRTDLKSLTMMNDAFYIISVAMSPGISGVNHLLLACKIGAARELFEETGIDLRTSLDRVKPLQLRSSIGSEHDSLNCEFKKRVLFSVDIHDDDMFTKV
jgi:8-oxo-dGTP pyrophosphatase MutT (NUDIX family)